MSGRLGLRLALRLGLAAVLVTLAGAALTHVLMRDTLLEQAELRTERMAAAFSLAWRDAPASDREALRKLAERFAALEEVRQAALFDAAGGLTAQGNPARAPDAELVSAALARGERQTLRAGDLYRTALPLPGPAAAGERMEWAGAAYLELGFDRSLANLARLNRILLGVVVMAAVAQALLGLVVLRRLVLDRLAPVVQGLASVEAGLHAPRLPAGEGRGADEIDRLAGQFNHMADTIEARTAAKDEAESALRQAYVALERMVRGRTEELEAANARLQAEVEERRGAENALHEQKLFLSTVLEGIKAAIFLFDPQAGAMVSANSVALGLLGIEEHELTCRDEGVAFVAEGRRRSVLCPEWSEKGTYMEGVLHLADGRRVPVARHLLDIFVDGREHLVQLFFDIAERKALERRLSIAQKLESIGLLASGIAHEINTPIQYVGDSVQFLEDSFATVLKIADACVLPGGGQGASGPAAVSALAEEADLDFLREEIPRACARAREGVQRVSRIVLAMKNFAHPGGEEKKPADINQAVQNTIMVARNAWKYVAEIATDLSEELPLIPCRLGDVNQVLLNMVVNAAHAIAEKNKDGGAMGRITITTRVEGGDVLIDVADTGTGIPREHLDRIFDPFFTTKEVGRGTGQGLAMAHDIVVEKHGGAIEVRTEPGVGTTFTVRLPIDPADARQDNETDTLR